MLFEADYAKNYASILYQCLMFVDEQIQNVPTTSKMYDIAWLHQDVQEQAPDFFWFLLTQPAVWAWETWSSVVWASQSTCQRHDLQRLWYLADGRLLFIFNLSNAESRGTWKERSLGWTDCRAATLTFFFLMLTRRRSAEDSDSSRREGRQTHSPLASQ